MRIGKRSLDDLAKRWARAGDNAGPVSRVFVWDDEIAGFGVRRQADGSASFLVKYRLKGDARQRLVTLGVWPTMHPDTAREEARRIKEAASLGRDLLGERRAVAQQAAIDAVEARRRATPLTDILDDWRTATEAMRDSKLADGRSTVTERELLRLEAKHLRPFLKGEVVGTFDPDRLQVLLDQATGHSAAANQRNLIARFIKYARSWLLELGIKVNWSRTYEIAQARPKSRDHRYSLEEAARLWIAAGGLGRRGALVRFMLLSAGRRTECAKLKWEWVEYDDAQLGPMIELPLQAVKHRRTTRVPLSPPAVALLRWLPPRESRRHGAGELVFAGRGNRQVGGWTDILQSLLAKAKVPDGTFHDIRRTVVSTLGDHGWDVAVVDRVLNHAASATMPGVMGVYQKSELWEQKRRALEAWANLLMAEVAKVQGQPVDRETWGFDQPFQDAQINRRRPRHAQRQVAA